MHPRTLLAGTALAALAAPRSAAPQPLLALLALLAAAEPAAGRVAQGKGRGQGQGEAKLTALREMLEAIDGGFEKAWPTIQKIVAVLVALFNKTGWGK